MKGERERSGISRCVMTREYGTGGRDDGRRKGRNLLGEWWFNLIRMEF